MMFKKSLICIVVYIVMSTFCFAQRMVEEEVVVDEYQDIPIQEPASRGYLTEGSTTYGIKGVVVEDDSPLTELKLLRKKYLTETKRTEKMESEMRILKERVEHLTMMIEKKDHELGEMQEKGVAMRFQYLALDNKLTNLRMAILRKKLVRESQYPPYYEVKKNDSLWRIAAMRQIYDNPYKWINIYHANQDKISDPDYIYPGMVLTIDRPEMKYEDWTVEGLNLEALQDNISAPELGVTPQHDTSVFPVNMENPIDLDNDAVVPHEVIIETDEAPADEVPDDEDNIIEEKYFDIE